MKERILGLVKELSEEMVSEITRGGHTMNDLNPPNY
jgi:hypothetical protein